MSRGQALHATLSYSCAPVTGNTIFCALGGRWAGQAASLLRGGGYKKCGVKEAPRRENTLEHIINVPLDLEFTNDALTLATSRCGGLRLHNSRLSKLFMITPPNYPITGNNCFNLKMSCCFTVSLSGLITIHARQEAVTGPPTRGL